jgi:high-affinity iron transporter
VSIVGAFLARSGRSVRPMFVGVGLAVALSIAVGVGLDLLSTALPQRQQEMLETVVGAVAVVFVTTMILWMNRNSGHLKGELEHDAARALRRGGSLALVVMAFLAVLKEGFETSVFLLAAAQATHGSPVSAMLGAVAGIAVSIGIGTAIFFGGVKLNLGRFFRITGVFLVLIAAGLVAGALRTAHEAGWVEIGQRQVLDLSWWMPAHSVQGALITGMFGIPSDPRLIEVLGWLLYAVPVLVVFLWPPSWAAAPLVRRNLLLGTAAGLAAAALALAVLVPAGPGTPGPSRTALRADGVGVTVTLSGTGGDRSLTVDGRTRVPLQPAGSQSAGGVTADVWQARLPTDPGVDTSTVSLAQLAELAGGRLPVGLGRAPGPFAATWQASTSYEAVSHGDSLLNARAAVNRTAVLSGGGLTGSRTVSLGAMGTDWATADDDAVTATLSDAESARAESALWRVWLPALLIVAAACTAWCAVRIHRRTSPTPEERTTHDADVTPEITVP